ncbi:MAG: acyl carrier protein [Sediminicola sp.]|jgi:acyl carrier protein|tara:strand:- start:4189 stop:4401 length:213 start_codon:yes stop_codon:yes gene_type:complete
MKEKLLGQIAEILEVDDVTINEELNNFDEWDSLTALSIIALVDSDYNKRLSNIQLKGFVTIGDLVAFILN